MCMDGVRLVPTRRSALVTHTCQHSKEGVKIFRIRAKILRDRAVRDSRLAAPVLSGSLSALGPCVHFMRENGWISCRLVRAT